MASSDVLIRTEKETKVSEESWQQIAF